MKATNRLKNRKGTRDDFSSGPLSLSSTSRPLVDIAPEVDACPKECSRDDESAMEIPFFLKLSSNEKNGRSERSPEGVSTATMTDIWQPSGPRSHEKPVSVLFSSPGRFDA